MNENVRHATVRERTRRDAMKEMNLMRRVVFVERNLHSELMAPYGGTRLTNNSAQLDMNGEHAACRIAACGKCCADIARASSKSLMDDEDEWASCFEIEAQQYDRWNCNAGATTLSNGEVLGGGNVASMGMLRLQLG